MVRGISNNRFIQPTESKNNTKLYLFMEKVKTIYKNMHFRYIHFTFILLLLLR